MREAGCRRQGRAACCEGSNRRRRESCVLLRSFGVQSERVRDKLLSIIAERGHARQRASDGDVLELPTAVFATKDIGSVRIVSKDGDDIERL